MKYVVTAQKYDDDSVYIELPNEMLEELDWAEGDTISWVEAENGSYTLRKVKYDPSNEA